MNLHWKRGKENNRKPLLFIRIQARGNRQKSWIVQETKVNKLHKVRHTKGDRRRGTETQKGPSIRQNNENETENIDKKTKRKRSKRNDSRRTRKVQKEESKENLQI